jgi:transcriptional regulator with XRE-family HTH domain
VNDSATVGDRLREIRKRRGMTQRDLARESRVSLSLIRKVEQGDHDRVGAVALRKLAVALDVPVTALLTVPAQPSHAPASGEMWQPLATALAGHEADEEPPAAGDVSSALTSATRLYHANRYAELAAVLPGMVRDASLTSPALRSRVFQLAGSALTQARQREAARVALDRSFADAEAAGSVLDAASAVITQAWLMLGERRFDDVRLTAALWADRVEPKLSAASRAEISAWGWLLLRASAAAIRDNRPGEGSDFMRLAEAAATVAGPERGGYHMYFTTFGPATVAMKKVENAVIDGRPGLALDLAGRVPPGLRPTSDNRNRHLLDMTAAHLDLRQYAAASDVLHRLAVQAPAWLTAQPTAASLMSQIIARRRLLTPQMRELAGVMRLPL